VTNREVAKALNVGVNGIENYMKPLGFIPRWETEKGKANRVKVWIGE
jgi:hypothetical protein